MGVCGRSLRFVGNRHGIVGLYGDMANIVSRDNCFAFDAFFMLGLPGILGTPVLAGLLCHKSSLGRKTLWHGAGGV